MGDVIPFPIEKRRKQIAAEAEAKLEYVVQPGWFGVRIRPELPTVIASEGASFTITSWLGTPTG